VLLTAQETFSFGNLTASHTWNFRDSFPVIRKGVWPVADNLVRRTKKLGIVGVGAFAISASLFGFGAGTAAADDISGDPSAPTSGPSVEDGVRVPATQGTVRSADTGVALAGSSEVRGSNRAVPTVKGDSPPPGNLSVLGYDCLFSWSQFC
jgi:hypothetical protein